jgi:hypothetical protein
MSTTVTSNEQNIDIIVNNDVIDINVTTSVVDVNTTTEIINIEAAGTYPLPATVYSVFGRTGNILALNGDYNTSLVTENTNLYFTNARARSAITLTTTGTSGAATYNSTTGVLNVPEYQGGVTSFNTRTGAISLLSADVTGALGFTPYNATNPAGYISGITSGMVTTALGYTPVTNARTLTINGTTYDLTADRSWTISAGVSSVGLSAPTGFSVTNSPITTSGTLALGFSAGYSLPTDASQSTWNTAYNRSLLSAAVTGTTTKTLTLNQQDGGTITASWTDINTDAVTSVFGRTGAVVATEGDYNLTQLGDVTITTPANGQVLKYNGTSWVNGTDTDTGLTSVGLSMPSAFTVANSPLTLNGTLSVTGAGTTSQYVRGDGTLANFPTSGGGGSSVSYYLNGSVNQGTIGGVTYYEMNKVPVIGTGTDFARGTNGYIASFLTDANDPALLEIPAGNWNFETYFNASNGGGSPNFYIELYKYDGTTFTLIASNSATPKLINDGASIEAYFSALAVPQTTLTLTDRLAVRIYVNTSGRTITLHTENGHLCQVITTFTTGITALNGLTAQVQFFGTGTSGTDFNISSATATHTFNLPVASALNTGKLSSSDWSVFNNKQTALSGTGFVKISGTTISYDNSTYYLASNPSAFIALTALSAGTGINYNNTTGVITNSAPDQTVTLTAGTGISVSGTYPSFTIASTITQYTDVLARASLSFVAGSGAYNSTTGVITIPTNTSQLTNGANYITLTSLSGSTGISYNNTTGAISSTITQYTDALARASISLTTTGSSGAATYDNTTGVLNIPQYSGGGGGSISLAAIGSTPNANAATLTGTVLNLEPASATFGGVVTTGTQSFAGAKTLSSTGRFSFKTAVNTDASLNIGDAVSVATDTNRAKIVISNTTGGSELILGQSGTNNLLFNWTYNATAANAYGVLETYAGNNNLVIQSGAGRIGFGTTTIGSKVQINGNAAIGYSASTAAPSNGLAVSGSVLINTTSTTGTFAPTLLIRQNSTNYAFEIKTTSAKTSTTLNKFMALSSSDATSPQYLEIGIVGAATNSNRYFSFQTSEFLIADSGNIVFQPRGGNVGIGATTIGSKLQVNGNAAIGYNASTAAPTNGMSVAGTVNVGTNTSVTTAALQVSSTTQGFLPPVMTTTQKNAITSPATGLVVFDSTLGKLCVFSGTWQTITSI